MHKIIEAIYPIMDDKEQIKLLEDFLDVIDKRQSSTKIFMLIYRLFSFDGDILELYESIGPSLETVFGDNKCCSLRWGIDILTNGMTIQKRCEKERQPGFLYCAVHRRVATDPCKSCLNDIDKEIIHQEGWEHFGNIFDKSPRAIITANFKKLGTSTENHINYSNYLLFNTKPSSDKIEKPKIKKDNIEHINCIKSKKEDLKNKVKVKKPKQSLSDEDKKILETALYYYVLSKGLIKPKKIDDDDCLEQLRIYDSDIFYCHDKRFVYKKEKGKGLLACGIYLNCDSCIMLDALETTLRQMDDKVFVNLNEFVSEFVSE